MFAPADDSPQTQHRIAIQRKQEEEFDFEEYCLTQALLSQIDDIAPEVVPYGNLPKNYLTVNAKIVSGPDKIGKKSFHYPLTIKTINLNDTANIFSSNRPFYPDTTVGIEQAESKIIYDLRNQLSEYGIQKGYKVQMVTHYHDSKITNEFGPFVTPFEDSDADVDPNYIKKTLFWGFDGSVLEMIKYLKNKDITPGQREIAIQALTEFCIFAPTSDPEKFSNDLLRSLCEHAPKFIKNPKAIDALKILSQSRNLQTN
jgi:hypothetical protein